MSNKKRIKDEKTSNKSIINRTNILFVNIQVFLTVLVIILFIVCLFNKKFIIGVEISLFFALLCMAYNNFKIYKRKFATIMYLVVAFVLLVLCIIRLFGIGG